MSEEFCILPPGDNYSTVRTTKYCHRHEIFYSANRQKSIKYGLVVFLTPEMHNMSNSGVHFNREFDLYLKRIGQKAWQDYYNKTKDDFLKEFKRSYL